MDFFFFDEERPSDSSFIERIYHSWVKLHNLTQPFNYSIVMLTELYELLFGSSGR
jgi:hypothetical protein